MSKRLLKVVSFKLFILYLFTGINVETAFKSLALAALTIKMANAPASKRPSMISQVSGDASASGLSFFS